MGSHTDLTAAYAGATNYAPSTSAPLSEQINQASTSLTLQPPVPILASAGESVTPTLSTVSPVAPGSGIPTGIVTFEDGGTTLGSGVLSNGGCSHPWQHRA